MMRFKANLLLAALLTGAFCSSQEQQQPTTPDGIVHSIIDAIEKNYLQTRANPFWNIARDALLAGKYKDSAQVFQAAQKQLAFMQDSELNLLNPTEIAAVQSVALGQKVGVGLADFCIDLEVDSGRARVITPIMGSPAMHAGIQPHDVIVSIDDKQTSDMNHEQVMDGLRAPVEDGVKLKIQRAAKTLNVVLASSEEKLDVLHFEAKRVSSKSVGYIRVALFTPDLGAAARAAVAKLEQDGVDGYILDLRNDPGGFLNSARDLAGLFTSGTLGYKLRGNGKKEAVETQGKPLTSKPVAVLINAGTASASEFVAGALQGLKRARLVGERSYGRGRAQIFMPLAEGYGIQIPAVELLNPDQKGFKGKGIDPDVEVKQPQLQETELTGAKDRQFLAAVKSLTTDEHSAAKP